MTDLKWKVQFATPTSNDLLHWANSPLGQFEIFETAAGPSLLHFPRGLRQPAELFDSLMNAKARAEEVANPVQMDPVPAAWFASICALVKGETPISMEHAA